MAKSIKQIEAEVLSYLDTIGQDAGAFQEVTEMDSIEKMMILSAANFIIKVQENLQRLGKVDTGTLSTKIDKGDVIESGGSYSIEVGYEKGTKAAKYYDYVNKGVRGTKSGEPADSPYSFKSDYPSSDMTLNLAKWYRRHASAGRRESQKKGLSAVQRKRKKLSKMVDANKSLRSLAYATAINIKRRGLKRTGFFDDAIKYSFSDEFTKALAKITGKEIAINLRTNGNNSR